MSLVRANGITHHVQRLDPVRPSDAPASDGGAPTAVLIHGLLTDTLASWYFTLAEPLAAAGLPVLLYDLRGHGRSERPTTGYTLDDFTDDLAALLAALDVTGPLYLFGNSFGGTIAFHYALRYPARVATVVTVESAPPVPPWFARIAHRLDRMTARLAATADPPGGRRASVAGELLTGTGLARELTGSRLPDPARFTAVRCPVLCVYGGDSAVGELAPLVTRLLPQSRVVVLPHRGHQLLIDDPRNVRRIVGTWLRPTGPNGPGCPSLPSVNPGGPR